MATTSPGACSVIGLGKLGAPIAAVLARAGIDVWGVDLDDAVVAALASDDAPHPEPGLQAAVDAADGRLRVTADLGAAVASTPASFVIVPTPSDELGRFRNDLLVGALREIGAVIAAKDGPHVVAVVSTVMPGSTAAELAPALVEHAGRPIGPDLGLCYSPVFVALGSVVRDLVRPDLLLIGESDAWSGDTVSALVGAMCVSDPPLHRMSWVNAEIAKLAVNTFVTTKISYANMLSEICEQLPGADVDVVTGAIGDDHRIGHAYLRGATAYGGPCFPRDNLALGRAAEVLGVDASLAVATDVVNRRQATRVTRIAGGRAEPDDRIAILGVAYKPDTAVTEDSAGLAVARELLDAGFEVACYDPGVDPDTELDVTGLKVAAGLEECVRDASVVVVMTPWPEFRQLPDTLRRLGEHPVIVDCWRSFHDRALDFDVVTLGAAPPPGP